MNTLDTETDYNKYGETIYNIPSHKCVSSNKNTERNQFCYFCGIYLPSSELSNYARRSFRSREYTTYDPTRANSNSIITEMIRKQSVNRYYNVKAPNLENRGGIIEWMRVLCQNLNYKESTCYLAISYLDAIFSLYVIKEAQLKLMGFVSVYVAAKMEEEDAKIPLIDEAVKLFKDEFTKIDFINCEMFLFKVLNYNLQIKTPFSFLSLFFSKGILFSDDFENANINESEIEYTVKKVEQLSMLFLDLSLKYYDFYQFSAIAIATAALACARKCMSFPIWIVDLEKISWVNWESIKDCTHLLLRLLEESHPDIYAQFFPEKLALPEQYTFDVTPEKKAYNCFDSNEEMTKDRGSIEEESTVENSADWEIEKRQDCYRTNAFLFSSGDFNEERTTTVSEFRATDDHFYRHNDDFEVERPFSNLILENSFTEEEDDGMQHYRICNNADSNSQFI